MMSTIRQNGVKTFCLFFLCEQGNGGTFGLAVGVHKMKYTFRLGEIYEVYPASVNVSEITPGPGDGIRMKDGNLTTSVTSHVPDRASVSETS